MATPPISMTAIPMEAPAELPDATVSRKSKMAASKLQIRIFQLVHKISTKFLRLCHVFGVRQYGKTSGITVRRLCMFEIEDGGHRPEVDRT